MMKRMMGGLAAAAVLASGAGAANAGCLSGAVVGGVAGHVAGRHTLLGAAAGCAVGHHMAVMHKRQLRAQRMAARGY
jgi:hypothetical protein